MKAIEWPLRLSPKAFDTAIAIEASGVKELAPIKPQEGHHMLIYGLSVYLGGATVTMSTPLTMELRPGRASRGITLYDAIANNVRRHVVIGGVSMYVDSDGVPSVVHGLTDPLYLAHPDSLILTVPALSVYTAKVDLWVLELPFEFSFEGFL